MNLWSYIRSVHSENTPDSWMRWVGTAFTAFLVLILGYCVFWHHVLDEAMSGTLKDLAYTIYGGGALRKGIEVAGSAFAPKDPPPSSLS